MNSASAVAMGLPQLDAPWGVIFGAGITATVTLIAAVAGALWALWRDKGRRGREIAKARVDNLRSAYEFTANVLFNASRGNPGDRATQGDAYAKLMLYGSKEVQDLASLFLTSPDAFKQQPVEPILAAMVKHLAKVEAEY